MHDDDGLDQSDRKLLGDIEAHGWHVVLITADQSGPGYGFSVGMKHTLGQPEICVFGLQAAVAHHVINEAGRRVSSEGPIPLDVPLSGFLEGYFVLFRLVPEKWYHEYFGYARWFYRSNEFRMLQCIWPDKAGRWPWEPEFNSTWKSQQPLLI